MDSKEKEFDLVGFVMDFEAGELSDEEIIAGFQRLIDSGLAWQLQGFYGSTAVSLIEAGYCQADSCAIPGEYSARAAIQVAL